MSERAKHGMGAMILLILFIVIFAGLAVYVFNFSLRNRKIDLEKALALIKSEYSFAEIFIISNNGNYLTAGLKLIDAGGSVLTGKTFTLNGRDIFLESKVAVVKNGKFSNAVVFPFNLYSDRTSPEKGESITDLYAVNGFPSTYILTNMDEQYKNTLIFLFEKAMKAAGSDTNITLQDIKVNFMDISLHPAEFSSIEEGRIYKCSVHPNGGLELMEEK
jgi:hypothetical protein